nr:NAD(P)-dependent oxidoreductase [Paracraurococcus ruber]
MPARTRQPGGAVARVARGRIPAGAVTRPHILVTSRAFPETLARLAEFATVEANEGEVPWPPAELLRRAAGADGLLAFMPDHVDAAFLAAAPRLRAIGCALKGADNFDLAACAARGIAVSVVPDLLTAPTAELAIALMLGLGRRLREGDALVRGGGFAGWRPVLYGAGIEDSVVGLLGLGAVGRDIARRLAGFGCRLLFADEAAAPMPPAERRDWPTLLAESDWLVLAAPLTPGTLHILDAAALAALKPGALVVNIARGSLVRRQRWPPLSRPGGSAATPPTCSNWRIGPGPTGRAPCIPPCWRIRARCSRRISARPSPRCAGGSNWRRQTAWRPSSPADPCRAGFEAGRATDPLAPSAVRRICCRKATCPVPGSGRGGAGWPS